MLSHLIIYATAESLPFTLVAIAFHLYLLTSPAMGHWTRVPLTSYRQFIFFSQLWSLKLGSAQSLTATVCGCFFKHICILRKQML